MAKKVTDTKILSAVAKHYDKFHESENFCEILNNFTSLCELLEIQPTHFVNFYPDLKVKFFCWDDHKLQGILFKSFIYQFVIQLQSLSNLQELG